MNDKGLYLYACERKKVRSNTDKTDLNGMLFVFFMMFFAVIIPITLPLIIFALCTDVSDKRTVQLFFAASIIQGIIVNGSLFSIIAFFIISELYKKNFVSDIGLKSHIAASVVIGLGLSILIYTIVSIISICREGNEKGKINDGNIVIKDEYNMCDSSLKKSKQIQDDVSESFYSEVEEEGSNPFERASERDLRNTCFNYMYVNLLELPILLVVGGCNFCNNSNHLER